jgi:hypothetical protein
MEKLYTDGQLEKRMGSRNITGYDSSDGDDDSYTKEDDSKKGKIVACDVDIVVDNEGDDLSDDEFQNTTELAVEHNKKFKSAKNSILDISHTVNSLPLFKDVVRTPPVRSNEVTVEHIVRLEQCLPVFIGLLSLSAVPQCRILDTTDLDHPR